MRNLQRKKIAEAFIKIALLGLAAFFIYKKLETSTFQSIFQYEWKNATLWVSLFFFLWVFNLILDALIWKKAQSLAAPRSFTKAFQSNLATYALSFVTPMNSGEVAARYLTLPKTTDRRKVLFLIFWSHFPRLIVKILLGGSAAFLFVYFDKKNVFFLIGILLLFLLILTLYFSFKKIQQRLSKKGFRKFSFSKFMIAERPFFKEKVTLLVLAFLKFLTYNFQFISLLLMWGAADFSLGLLAAVFFFFFVTAVLPTLAFADFLIKGAVALFVFQTILMDEALLINATLVVWMFNIALPALAGGIFILKMD